MSDEAESLNNRIEQAWCALDDCIGKRLFYITLENLIGACKDDAHVPRGATTIGWFTRACDLDEFRRQVFFVFDRKRGIA